MSRVQTAANSVIKSRVSETVPLIQSGSELMSLSNLTCFLTEYSDGEHLLVLAYDHLAGGYKELRDAKDK